MDGWVLIMNIRQMTINDYDIIMTMFQETPGVEVREADSRDATEAYLNHNPGLSFVATIDSKVIGCVMCGHDGRRGYLQHLVVMPEHRRQGVGEKLFTACINALQKIGVSKTHIFVFKTNDLGNAFWTSKGWHLREEINMYSYNSSSNENA
jgi:ribosomal protein S18 acetylase RimI-like enzyme